MKAEFLRDRRPEQRSGSDGGVGPTGPLRRFMATPGSRCARARNMAPAQRTDIPMIMDRLVLGLSIAALTAVAGCGGDDPLTGTWSNQSCYGASVMPAGVESCKTELTFSDDLTFSLKAQQFSMPATAKAPGCTTTLDITGQTWSTDDSILTLNGLGRVTVERTSCINDGDELKQIPAAQVDVPRGEAKYTIVDDSLTLESGEFRGTYTR